MCGSRLSSGRRGSILGQILKKLLEGLGGAGLGEGVQDHITAFTVKGQRTGRSWCYHCGHCHYICSCASVGNGLRRDLYINQPIHINGGYMILPSWMGYNLWKLPLIVRYLDCLRVLKKQCNEHRCKYLFGHIWGYLLRKNSALAFTNCNLSQDISPLCLTFFMGYCETCNRIRGVSDT